MKPATAGSAIRRPSADDVPTARWTGKEKLESVGTESVPPPIPISEETKPMTEATARLIQPLCGK